MSDHLFSSREGAAVTLAALRRLELEEATQEATRLRPWCRARCRGWASPAGPSALVLRWKPHYRRWRYKHTNHICAHLSAALVSKSRNAIFTVLPGSFSKKHTDNV